MSAPDRRPRAERPAACGAFRGLSPQAEAWGGNFMTISHPTSTKPIA